MSVGVRGFVLFPKKRRRSFVGELRYSRRNDVRSFVGELRQILSEDIREAVNDGFGGFSGDGSPSPDNPRTPTLVPRFCVA
jgi:hypothetical protein